MKNFVIGIAGVKNSGKDTVASMINYIFAAGVSKAKYQDWVIKQAAYDSNYKDRIIHFADPLKDVLSIIYNIPRYKFDDREYKDELWFCFNTNSFIENANQRPGNEVVIVNIDTIKSFSLNTYLKINNDKLVCIKLRSLLQYFATEICRDKLDDDIWIKCAIGKIVTKAESRRLCIVPDVRFANEADALRISNDSLYGGVIEVRRNDAGNTDNHDSETIDFGVDEVIENNGTKMALFYKVLSYVEFIVNKK
jgi:hypothetical protein